MSAGDETCGGCKGWDPDLDDRGLCRICAEQRAAEQRTEDA